MSNGFYGYESLRNNEICFELIDKNGSQFLAFRDPNSTYSSYYGYRELFIVQAKDTGTYHPASLSNALSIQTNLIRAVPLKSLLNKFKPNNYKVNPSFIDGVLKDLEDASNPTYIGNYCIALIFEMTKMDTNNANKYAKQIIRWMSYTNNIVDEAFDKLIDVFDKNIYINSDLKEEFYLKLAQSHVDFDICPLTETYIKRTIKEAINKGITDLDENLLFRFPIANSSSPEADLLYENYHGLGIYPNEIPTYLMKRKKVDELYSFLTKYPAYLKTYFNNKDRLAIYLIRYLATNGYQDKVKELAMKLLPYVKSAKDYYSLRVFLTDDELMSSLPLSKDSYYDYVDSPCFLSIHLESNELAMKIAKRDYIFGHGEYIILSYVFGYTPNDRLRDYYCKDLRQGIRDNMFYSNSPARFFYATALGLIAYGDKTVLRYFCTKESDDIYLGDPYYALIRAFISCKTGKKVKDIYQYPEEK